MKISVSTLMSVLLLAALAGGCLTAPPVQACEGGCLCAGASAADPLADPGQVVLQITPHTLHALVKNGVQISLLEICATETPGMAKIPGARAVPASSTAALVASEAGPLEGFVVVYPADPGFSAKAFCDRLRTMNYRTVIEFPGGAPAWASAGFELDRP